MQQSSSNNLTNPGASYRTLREIAQEALFRDIVERRLKPGQKLTEGELAELYGIGRAPIREALRALEGTGLVRALPNRGVMVTDLSRDEVQEIYEIRVALEGLAAGHAARAITDEQLADVERRFAALSDALDDATRWLALNNEFHLAYYAASGREWLCRAIGELMTLLDPYVRSFLDRPESLLATHADHERILDALRRRDGAACERETREHLERAAQIVRDLVPDDGDAAGLAVTDGGVDTGSAPMPAL